MGGPADDRAGSVERWTCRFVDLEIVRGATEHLAAARALGQLVAVLAPVLGGLGVASLLSRGCAVAKTSCADLDGLSVPTDSLGASSAAVHAHLAALPPAKVRGALACVVAAVVGLLTKFVGERLALQLLERAWPDVQITQELP